MNTSQLIPDIPAPSILDSLSFRAVSEALIVLAIAWVLIWLAHRWIESLARRSARGGLFVMRLEPIVRMTLWFVAVFEALHILAPSSETFLALLASIGLAVGLGAQDLVRNVLGGIVVLTDRPFQLGDRVKIGDAYGVIDHIGLRSTKLTTPDDTRVTIPNSMILSGMVFNANSGVPDCQVVTDVVVPYGIDPDLANAIGQEAAFASPYLLLDKPVVVLLMDKFDRQPYCLLRVKAYVYDHRFEPRMQSDITSRVKQALAATGVIDRDGPARHQTPVAPTDVLNPPVP